MYFLFWPHAKWIDTEQVDMKEVEIPSKIDGYNLKAVILRNKLSDRGEKQPGVLFHHGYLSRRQKMYKYAIPLALYGCTVLCIDARGNGESKNKVFSKDDVEGMISDVENEINFLENLENVDKNRLCMMGTSLGAQMTLTAGYQDQRLKKLVALSGAYNGYEMFKKHKPIVTKFINSNLVKFMKKNNPQFDDEAHIAWNKRISAQYFLEKKGQIPDKDRVYLVHGKEDNLVLFEESLRTKEALNLPNEIVLFLNKPLKKYTLSAHELTGQETIVTAYLISVVKGLNE